jgi:hypothetical protein
MHIRTLSLQADTAAGRVDLPASASSRERDKKATKLGGQAAPSQGPTFCHQQHLELPDRRSVHAAYI